MKSQAQALGGPNTFWPGPMQPGLDPGRVAYPPPLHRAVLLRVALLAPLATHMHTATADFDPQPTGDRLVIQPLWKQAQQQLETGITAAM